jgi:hypothetical protein
VGRRNAVRRAGVRETPSAVRRIRTSLPRCTARCSLLVVGRVTHQVGRKSLLAAAALSLFSLAAADEVPAEIAYDAMSDGCPSREAFLAEARQRMLQPVAGGGRDDRKFRVVLADTRGVLEIEGTTEGAERREVEGVNCAEVAKALAFSLALAIKPKPPPPPRPEPPWWSAGIAAVSLVHSSPYPALGGSIFIGVPLAHSRAIMPHLHLALAYARTVTAYDDVAAVQWSWFTARVALCAFHLGGSSWGIQPCISLDAGAIVAEAAGLSLTELRPWLAPGLGARAFWGISDFLIELGATASLPRRYDFYRPGPVSKAIQDNPGTWAGQEVPNVLIHEMPVIGATFTMGVGYRWR